MNGDFNFGSLDNLSDEFTSKVKGRFFVDDQATPALGTLQEQIEQLKLMLNPTAIVPCQYCGQPAAAFTSCVHCGAPVSSVKDYERMKVEPTLYLPAPGWEKVPPFSQWNTSSSDDQPFFRKVSGGV